MQIRSKHGIKVVEAFHKAWRAASILTAYVLAAHRSAELYSISICPNHRGPRRFCGARLCEPQHVEIDRRAGFLKTLGGQQSSCGSQTRAPLVAAAPRFAVSQSFTLPDVGNAGAWDQADALPNTVWRVICSLIRPASQGSIPGILPDHSNRKIFSLCFFVCLLHAV